VSGLKPAYLVCGDDDAKIDAWRARLRKRAEAERGPGGLEAFDARQSDPEEVVAALSMLSFDPSMRYLLVDDAGAWKPERLAPLEAALEELPPDTLLVLIVRGSASKGLAKAVENAGGELREYAAPSARELPRWCVERARDLGLRMDNAAARVLIARVGGSQQRLARELEKLQLALYPAETVTAEDVERLAASDTVPKVYALADALTAGDLPQTLRLAEELVESGERPGGLLFGLVRGVRDVHRAALLLESGMSEQAAAGALKGPPWLAKKTVSKAKRTDAATLERTLCILADLELELRGGGEVQLPECTAFSLALARTAA
jgi:DNA polymerase-3 subunit delta